MTIGDPLLSDQNASNNSKARPYARHAIAATLAATLAILDLSAIILLISGAQRTVRLPFRIVRQSDVFGAAQVGVVLWAIVLGWAGVTEWSGERQVYV